MSNEVAKLCLSLCNHTLKGNTKDALKTAEALSKLKQVVKVIPDSFISKKDKWNSDYCDLTEIIIEDSEETEKISYNIPKNVTIGELKEQFSKDFEIPEKNQVWIINGFLRKNKENIKEIKGNDHECSFCLYVIDFLAKMDQEYQIEEDIEVEETIELISLQSNSKETSNTTWTCPNCTRVFNVKQNFCTWCGHKKLGIVGWKCTYCPLINKPLVRSCTACDSRRPNDYIVPKDYVPTDPVELSILEKDKEADASIKAFLEAEKLKEEKSRMENQLFWQRLENQSLVENTVKFECPICIADVEPGDGVQLRNCTHQFCKECLKYHVKNLLNTNLNNEAIIKCPSNEGYECEYGITDRELRALVTDDEFQRIEQLRYAIGLRAIGNIFHCKTVNCEGNCQYEDGVNDFKCYLCNHVNCLICKAIHEGKKCKEYQDELALKALHDVNARKDKEALDAMVQNGEAMFCPGCNIIVTKMGGCDWIRCGCKVELCWATKQARWGPKGPGDISGGCKCNVGGKKCTPKCGNCH